MFKKYKKILIIFILFLLALIPSVYLYSKYRSAVNELQTIKTVPLDPAAKIIAEVARLISLPDGEKPTVATISDREKLSGQPFFQNAKNGDIVLIYSLAKKAILYDPIAKKIIDITPLSDNTPEVTKSPADALSPINETVSFILLNGTNETGLTRKYETELKQRLQNASVVDRDNAQKNDYQKSLLVNLKNYPADKAQKLSQTLGIGLSPLPDGEIASVRADFLIILGKDKT